MSAENNTLVRYIATILVGDDLHAQGEEHTLSSWEVEPTQKHGLKLKTIENNWGDTFYNLYPCTIKKITYKLEPIEISTIEGGDRMNCDYRKGQIGTDNANYTKFYAKERAYREDLC